MPEHPRRPGGGPWSSGQPPGEFVPFPDEAVKGSVADRLVEVVAGCPASTALRSPAGTWTYSQLLADASAVAAGVRELLGGMQDLPVAVLAAHDGPQVVALLGVILSGNVVVVLDAQAPEDHLHHVLDESGAALLVHDEAHAAVAASLSAAHEGLRSVPFESLDGDPFELPVRGPSDPVMLAFTSGTSGSPKGGIVTNGVILNLVRGATNALGIGPDDRMPMLFPVSLAVAAYPLFLPLLNGGVLSTLDVRAVGLDPVGPFLRDERITLAYMAPTVVRFLEHAVAGLEFPDLRLVALGGETVDAEVVELTRLLFRPHHVANGFGTTETGVIALYVLDSSEPVPEGIVPSGYPVADVELHVLADDGSEVGPGEAGEVAVTSPYLFKGYWGHPELNRSVLLPDPLGRSGWQLYRTGDLGVLDEHGALTVLGRVDTKVKVRGRFVVLGDVESLLRERDDIDDVVVTTLNRGGVTELAAVVATSPDTEFDATQVRSVLLESQESYRVPTRWVTVDQLPRLPNGKVDRRAAAALVEAASADSESAKAPGSSPNSRSGAASRDFDDQVLRAVRDIWEELLPGQVVAPGDDFFLLGGDSLLAAQMLVHVDRRLDVTVPMSELIRARTLEQVAATITRYQSGRIDPSSAVCVRRGDEEQRPRLWFVHDLQGSAYRVRHLAEHLDPQQPLWSFESPLLRGERNPFHSLDAFAARYVRDLLRAQPSGPYLLAGYSFGGICAFEMARQLVRDGREVAFLGVVDVGPGYRGPGWRSWTSPTRPWFGVAKPPESGVPVRDRVRHYREMAKGGPSRLGRHLMVRTGLSRVVDPVRFQIDLRRHGKVRPEWRLWYAWEEHWRLAARQWDRSRTYPGHMDLFWAEGTGSADATMGWGPLVERLTIHRFPGDHEGILEPRGAHHLASALEAALARHVP